MILTDMNLSPSWVQFLANHGIESRHWSSVGESDAPDVEILNHAAAHGFVVLTHDFDFDMILAARKSDSPSVIQVRAQDVLPDSIGTVLLRALNATAAQLETGALVVVEPTRHRIRLFPI